MNTPTIAGIETEYGIMIVGADNSDPFLASELILAAHQHTGYTAVPCRPYQSSSSHSRALPEDRTDLMLNNGARFYIDHAHPEYSTPECLSPRVLVAADKAGEHLLANCQHWSNTTRTLPEGQRILLYKNNSDYKNNSYGCHENYLIGATLFDDLLHYRTHKIFRYVLPFLITRTLYTGSGKVGSENGTAPIGFQLSQRADFFETLIGLQTTHQRPLFNTRDEAHANAARFRRLHVIIGDANMAEFSTYLKVGTMQLVLRMLEDEFITDDLTLAHPLNAMQAVSRDMTFQHPLPMEDGRKMKALDIQEIYLEHAYRYLTERGGEEEQWDVVHAWEETLALFPDSWHMLATRLDWAVKKRLLDRYLLSQGETWETVGAWQPVIGELDDLKGARHKADAAQLTWSEYDKQRELYFALRRLNLEYHDIRYNPQLGEVGLFYRLQQRGVIERVVTDEEIEALSALPPVGTRSWLRGRCIDRFAEQIVSADWESIHFYIPAQKQDLFVQLANPLLTNEAALVSGWENIKTPQQLAALAQE